jgi:hypothetical protein
VKLDARWTNDCGGKQDFDGPILSLSTRYWPGPEGGSGMVVTADAGRTTIADLPYGPWPSATAEILLHHGDEESITLREESFEAATEQEVKAMVEAWADSQFNDILAKLGRSR